MELLYWWINIIATDFFGSDMDVMQNEEGVGKVCSENRREDGNNENNEGKKDYRNCEQRHLKSWLKDTYFKTELYKFHAQHVF